MSALDVAQPAFRHFLRRFDELRESRPQLPTGGAGGGGKDDDDDEHDGLAEEYARLKEEASKFGSDGVFASSDGKLECNRKKNRYKDIVPFDSSRVRLKELDGVIGSDYINASFINGVSRPREYIAAQGPIMHTLTDFWRMIVEQGVRIIVMAAIDKEGHKVKCERYWPEAGEEKTFGDITVNLISEEWHNDYYVERLICVKWQQSSHSGSPVVNGARQVQQSFPAERRVVQYHYVAWPDHGLPSPNASISRFMAVVRQREREMAESSAGGSGDSGQAPPLLVHCSAGCGRTGTVIAIDFVQQLLANYERTGSAEAFRNFNLYDIVLNLRKQRSGMIQTKDQYSIVYQAVADLFREACTSIAGSSSASQGRKSAPSASLSPALDEMDELLADLNKPHPSCGSAGQQAPAVPPKSSGLAASSIASRPQPSRQLEEWPANSRVRDADDSVHGRPPLPRKITPAEAARTVAQPALTASAGVAEKHTRFAAALALATSKPPVATPDESSEQPFHGLQPTVKPSQPRKTNRADSAQNQPYDDHVLVPTSTVGRSTGAVAVDVAEADRQQLQLRTKLVRPDDPLAVQGHSRTANAAARHGHRTSDCGESASLGGVKPDESPAPFSQKGRDASTATPVPSDFRRVRNPSSSATTAGHAADELANNVTAAGRASEKLAVGGLSRSMTLQPRASAPAPLSSRPLQPPAAAAAPRTSIHTSSAPGPAGLASALAQEATQMLTRTGALSASTSTSRQNDLVAGCTPSAVTSTKAAVSSSSSAGEAWSRCTVDDGSSCTGGGRSGNRTDVGSSSDGGDANVYVVLELPQATLPVAQAASVGRAPDTAVSAVAQSQKSAVPGCRPLPALPDGDSVPDNRFFSPSLTRQSKAEDGQSPPCGDYVYVDLNATNKWPLQHIALGLPADPSVPRLSSPYSVANDDSCSSSADVFSPPAVPRKSASAYHYADDDCDDNGGDNQRDGGDARFGGGLSAAAVPACEEPTSKPKHQLLSSKAGDFISNKMKTILQTTKKTSVSEPLPASGYLKEDVFYHGVNISFPNRVSKPKGVQGMPRQWKLSQEDSGPFPRAT